MFISTRTGLFAAVLCIIALMASACAASTAGTQGHPAPGLGPHPQSTVLVPKPPQNMTTPPPRNTVPPGGTPGSQQYTMEQTLSDQAQKSTIAFDGLAFLTGQACCDTFLPPGKVADYAGFQYLRDNDPTQMGHNTDFVTRIADNVLSILNDNQLSTLSALSDTEAPLSAQYGYMRFPLMKAFRANLEGNIPSGGSGLDKAAIMNYSADLYDVDAAISIGRARTYANVIRSLNATQRSYLDRMHTGGMLNMPVADASSALRKSGHADPVAMRTYASEMYAWYAGNVTSDVYFCPERQATYFGSFYLKDGPAIGNPNYTISSSLTGDSGQGFLNLLTAAQREQVTGLVGLQRSDLTVIVAKRTAIATELRQALSGNTIDEAKVHALSRQYGALDGEISYLYATHFTAVAKTVTSEQKQKMVALRNMNNTACTGAYLYSQPIGMPANIPSDFLFGIGKYDRSAMSAWLSGLQQTAQSRVQGPAGGNGPVPKNGRNPGRAPGPAPGNQGPGLGNQTPVRPQNGTPGPNPGTAQAVNSNPLEELKNWLSHL